jgi:hypothetical protein
MGNIYVELFYSTMVQNATCTSCVWLILSIICDCIQHNGEAHLKTITLFRATTSITARSHPRTNADLQPTAVASIAYRKALISRQSSWTETNPQSLPRTSVARDTTMSYGMINSSSLRGRSNNASSDRKHHSTFPWIGQSSWETCYY